MAPASARIELVEAVGGAAGGDERLARARRVSDTPGHLDRVLHGEEQPGLGPLPRRQAEQVDAVEGDRARRAPRSRACPASTCESVDLPEPFGPMTAWTSPLRTTRSMPSQDLPAADAGAQALDHAARGVAQPSPVHDQHAAVDDRRRRRPASAGWPAATAARRCARANCEPCFQHSMRALVGVDLALGRARCRRGCSVSPMA